MPRRFEGNAATPMADLDRLISGLAADAINTQIRLDHGYAADLELHGSIPQGPRSWVPAPLRHRVREMSFDLRVLMDTRRVRGASVFAGVAVRALPLNISFDVRYQTSESEQSRVKLLVNQVPAPARQEEPQDGNPHEQID